jgi:fucose permease
MTRANKIWALALSCCIFFVIGINSSTLGAVLPYLARNTESTLATAGSIITALFLGALIAQFAVGPINDRVGPGRVLLAFMVLAGAGLVVASLSHSLLLTLVFMFISGTGTGAMIVSANVMLAIVFESRSVFALNFSNVFYGVGAICGPALSALMVQQWGSTLPIMWLTAGLLALLLPGALMLKVGADESRKTNDEVTPLSSMAHGPSSAGDRAPGVSVYKSPALWAIAGVLLIYVGTESGTSGWTITYLNRAAGLPLDVAAYALSGFYVALTAGRLLGAIVGVKLSARNLLTLSFLGGVVGALMLMMSGGNAEVMLAALLVFGFFLGPIYPTVVSLVVTTFAEAPGRAASFAMALGSIGGMTIPWLLGVLLEWSGTYGSITLLAGCTLAMLALHLGSGLARSRVRVDAAVVARET